MDVHKDRVILHAYTRVVVEGFDSVDGASRVSSGWMVSGTLFNGSGFTCQIDNNGRISNVDYGSLSSVSYSGDGEHMARAEGQWSDERYADARARVSSGEVDADIRRIDPATQAQSSDVRPAYPGGPLPGEEGGE